ncbi:hypothetical protein BU180_12610 [Listeria monocytogenes]|nr:hypothetical protein [Listeria monocytogenes]EAE9170061.1 hypothetical protein [Listeria monocytogenes]
MKKYIFIVESENSADLVRPKVEALNDSKWVHISYNIFANMSELSPSEILSSFDLGDGLQVLIVEFNSFDMNWRNEVKEQLIELGY